MAHASMVRALLTTVANVPEKAMWLASLVAHLSPSKDLVSIYDGATYRQPSAQVQNEALELQQDS